ncbi:hypothetical protein BD289DRAFT_452566 [Coniella lustricola]|uniref:Uncharacterized protein n=1 Tax=Coniella lustricola TaxID=2025994 RepID=A0A2T3AAL8_9PEZI|nr:hypothetical protein BD289DRAFT_452566 [Coniella lustricola]
MPYDRSSAPMAPSTSRQQPQAPSLAKRAHMTPKLSAGAARQPPTSVPQRQTVTLAAPTPRRVARPESVVSRTTAVSSASSRDDHGPPIANYLHSSATSRTPSSRPSRVNSNHSSPNPADASSDTWDNRSALSMGGSSLDAELARHSSSPAMKREPKFFYASEAPKPPSAPAQPKPTPPKDKGATFFYANGANRPANSSVDSTPNPDPVSSKFMYANGTPDLKPLNVTSASNSTVSPAPRAPAVRPRSQVQSPALGTPRTSSPPKPTTAPGHTLNSVPSIAERRNVVTSTPHLSQKDISLRRISTENPLVRTPGHSRPGSLVVEPPVLRASATASPVAGSPIGSPQGLVNPGLSMASVLQAADDMIEQDDDDSMVSGLTSPKSASGTDPLNDLVANARRERKVQDLQITNASLEAINRTLERQLRKQTNELRRYKRMARAGRVSSANAAAAAASKSATGDAQEGSANDQALSDLSEADSDVDEEDEDAESDLSDSDSTGSAPRSPSTMATRDARHRKRDEKRLQIDLSKHQQLLVDSQKMNQSLKRCLGWTEELIREGQRALAYQVRISEVDGQNPPEDGEKPYIYDGAALWEHEEQPSDEVSSDDDTDDSDQGEADADRDETMRLRIERLRPADELDGKQTAAQDRDSGIVLSGDVS